jgi:glucan 1,3-beta-glucosidase
VADDTAAINRAISDGGRFGPASRQSSTTTPAIVYFPAGTYLINSSIIDYYYTQLIGNPNSPAVIKATPNFTGLGLVDGDQYQNDGQQGWISTNVFYRQIRNLVFDLTAIPPGSAATGIHWPSAQATSIQNVIIRMTQAAGSQHQGLFIENGKPPAPSVRLGLAKTVLQVQEASSPISPSPVVCTVPTWATSSTPYATWRSPMR